MTIKAANQKLPLQGAGGSILDKIVLNKRKEVAAAKKRTSYTQPIHSGSFF